MLYGKTSFFGVNPYGQPDRKKTVFFYDRPKDLEKTPEDYVTKDAKLNNLRESKRILRKFLFSMIASNCKAAQILIDGLQ